MSIIDFPNTNGNRQANSPHQNDGGDQVVVGEMYIRRYGRTAKFLFFQIVVLLILAGFFGFIDYGLMLEIFKVKFADAVTGVIEPEEEILVKVAALITIGGFFFIGRMWVKEYRVRAGLLYFAILALLIVALSSQWGSDVKVLIFGNIHIGWTSTPTPNNPQSSMAEIVRWLYLFCISVVFTFGGLSFSYIEISIEKRYFALVELFQNLAECRAIIKFYTTEKQRLDEQEQDRSFVDLYSDPDVLTSLCQSLTMAYLQSYTETLSTEKNNLSGFNLLMSRRSQNDLADKKALIDRLLSQADTLIIP